MRYKLPKSVGPVKLCRIMYWFSQRAPLEQITKYSKAGPKSIRHVCYSLRKVLARIMLQKREDELLGGDNLAVLINETLMTTPKKTATGFGRVNTCGMQQWVMGFFELDLIIRMGTGRCI